MDIRKLNAVYKYYFCVVNIFIKSNITDINDDIF